MMFTCGDVCEVTGIESYLLNDWCVKGIVTPVEQRGGQGNHRRFSFMQIVGLAVALELRKATGCNLTYLGKIVRGFEQFIDEAFLNMLGSGKIYFAGMQNRLPHLSKICYHDDMVNVQTIHSHVQESVGNLTKRLRGGLPRRLEEANT